jgi:hypothetical protein
LGTWCAGLGMIALRDSVRRAGEFNPLFEPSGDFTFQKNRAARGQADPLGKVRIERGTAGSLRAATRKRRTEALARELLSCQERPTEAVRLRYSSIAQRLWLAGHTRLRQRLSPTGDSWVLPWVSMISPSSMRPERAGAGTQSSKWEPTARNRAYVRSLGLRSRNVVTLRTAGLLYCRWPISGTAFSFRA